MTQIKAIGKLNIVVTDAKGMIKHDVCVPNMVVSAGKNFIAQRVASATTPVMSHMAIGSVDVTPIAADVALAGELGRAVLDETVVTENTVAFKATFLPGVGSGEVREAGIFNADLAGDMLCRTTFAVINKAAADTMTIFWNVTIS